MPLPKKNAAAAPVVEAVNFGSLQDYSSGGAIPEGDYLISDFTVMMHQFEKKDGTKVGQPGLMVRVCFEPPTGASKEEEQNFQYYSMGSKAHESYAPNPDTGKGLVAVAGGKGGGLNDQSNWAIFLKSLYDCGLPEGIFTNDMTVLEGMQVHVQNQPEPESRKTMQPRTGEVAEERKAKTIAVISEIKEPAPWDGGGGAVAAAPAAPKPALKKPGAAPAAAPKPALAKPGLKKAPPAAPAPEPGEMDEEQQVAAFNNAVAEVLEKNQKGMPRMGLRTQTFGALKATVGPEVGTALVDAYFASDEALNAVLNQLGFGLNGTAIVPVTE